MRGTLSEGMLMCASSPEKVEIVDPPTSSGKYSYNFFLKFLSIFWLNMSTQKLKEMFNVY